MNVLCFADNEHHLTELLAGGRKVADARGGKVHAVTFSKDSKAVAHGADIVHVLETPDQNPGTLAAAVTRLAQSADANLVLIGSSKRGKAFAGMVAEKLGAAYAAEVSDVGFEGDKPFARRMLLSGNTNAVLRYETSRLVATANPKTWEARAADPARQGETQKAAFPSASKVQVVSVKKHEAAEVNLAGAKIVVGAGRGVKKKEDLAMLQGLADALGGALGCSRPIAADLKWLGEEHWIGLSGNEIKPRLYIACGISGQIQHLTGCRGSKTIVAINTDEDAPIFENSDYGIVADIYEVLPKLTELVRTKHK